MDEEFNFLGALADALHEFGANAALKAAQDVAALAEESAPDQTGFLKSTIYVSSKSLSTYGQGVLSPPKDTYLLEEETAEDDQSAIVGVAANYGIYQEMGTVHDAAQPFMIPSADTVGSTLETDAGSGLEDFLASVI